MNDVQSLIDRQFGIYCRLNYDNVLKRLMVETEESFYGLQNANILPNFDQDPPIFACRFSEAPGYEHILALANEDGRVAIQDTTNAKTASALESFQCHNNAVFDLAWMPGHLSFVTVSGDHTACLWDAAEGGPRRVLVFSGHTRSVKTAVFRPGEPSVFATGARDGHVLVWDARAAPGPVLRPDNRLSSCHSGVAPKTPGSHGKRARLDSQRAVSITGLAFQDQWALLSCGECDGNIKVWDLRKSYSAYTREPLPRHAIPYCGSSARHGYTNLALDAARTRLYASCMDNVIYCFNVAAYGALPERRYVGHENGTFYIKAGLSPDGNYLVSGSSDKRAYVWSVRRAEPLLRLGGHRAEVTCAAWCQRGDTTLVTCGDDARHMIWRVGREWPAPGAAPPAGRAEPAPRAPPAPACSSPPAPERRRAGRPPPQRKGKRCLTALLQAARDADDAENAVKRLRLSAPAEPAHATLAHKRPHEPSPERTPPSSKRPRDATSQRTPPPSERLRRASPQRTPPSKRPCETSPHRTPPSSKRPRASSQDRTPPSSSRPSEASPQHTPPPCQRPREWSPSARVRSPPTKDLPDFVLSGEAPHLRLMSPPKKKPDTTDWLTALSRGRRPEPVTPLAPRENLPARRNSVSEKTPKSTKKSITLLKYFTVASKEK